jgi:putative transposase
VIVAYVDAFKSRFGVEPICRVLTEHDVPIAPSTYYASKRRPPCARRQRDGVNLKLAQDLHRENYGAYGVRKLWHAMRHEQATVGRDQVARLMRLAGLRGHVRRQRVRTTIATPGALRSPDLVRRDWFKDAPDRIWVADFTHVLTSEGTAYVAFVQDAFSRRLLGFTVSCSKSADLVTRTLEQAVSVRMRFTTSFVADGVIHHSDAGSQYTSVALSQKLLEHGVQGSIGRVGTAYDNALMETTIGLYKTELVHARHSAWETRQQLETATAAWVRWFNDKRLHSSLGYVSPSQHEMKYIQAQAMPRQAA